MSLFKRKTGRGAGIWNVTVSVSAGKGTRRATVSTGLRDKRAAAEIDSKVQRLAALQIAGRVPERDLIEWVNSTSAKIRKRIYELGLIDGASQHSQKPVQHHIEEYLADCDDQSPTHVNNKRTELTRMVKDAGVSRLIDLTPERIAPFLHDLKASGQSARSVNRYRQTIKAFANWCRKQGRIVYHRLDALRREDEKKDKRRPRRAATEAELEALMATAPPDRRLKYLMAVHTGLRRKELLSLVVADVDLSRGTLRVDEAIAKAGESRTLPLHKQLVDALGQWIGPEAKPSDPLFKNLPTRRTLYKDLERAGIQREDARGRKFDFHSFRTTLTTRMLRQGITSSQAKKITRHQSIAVLEGHYNDLLDADAQETISRVPWIAVPASEKPCEDDAERAAQGAADGCLRLASDDTDRRDDGPRDESTEAGCPDAQGEYNQAVISGRQPSASAGSKNRHKCLSDNDLRAVGAVG